MGMAEYRDVNGVRTWWDELGAGEPAVLLHGGLTDSRDFCGNLDRLSSRFHLYLPERRGHGHTPDVEGPLSIEVMTEDAIAFIEQVCGGGPIRLVGYSAGANVALHVAVARQDLIERLGLISGAFHPDGMLVKPTAGGSPPPALLEAYAEVSPDGAEHFPVILAKVAAASDAWAGLSPQALASVEVPTLVVAADDDLVSLEHTVELYEALPAAALAVIPHASHLLLHEHPDELAQLVGDFLSEDPPVRMMPIRRTPA
jgi:pimeloyl-ACP methyl ester carboxylesterase